MVVRSLLRNRGRGVVVCYTVTGVVVQMKVAVTVMPVLRAACVDCAQDCHKGQSNKTCKQTECVYVHDAALQRDELRMYLASFYIKRYEKKQGLFMQFYL